MCDKEDQQDELLVLTSIYDHETISVSNDGDLHQGKVFVTVEIPQQFKVAVKDKEGTEHDVCHLPCVTLKFTMPSNYPSASRPNYALTCPWLTDSQSSLLSAELDSIWAKNAGSVILFTWISFLQTELLTFLDLRSPLQLTEDQLQDVLANDQTMRERTFASTVFPCQICLDDKPGSSCIRFWGCDHVFCKACLKNCFEMHIKEGSVSLLRCPEDKCGAQANPTQVKELVTPELFERYDRLTLQWYLDTMNDIIYCPRKDCGCPVVVEKEGRMGSCANCNYVFCIYCKRVYHGVQVCNMKSEAARRIRETYLSGTEEEKQELERRYGKKQLQTLVEEHFSEEWIRENSKKCPRCLAQVQKIDGCNKMTCSKCHAYFCWLCLVVLPADKPYDHYNTSTSSCYGGLFRGVDVAEDDDEDDFLNEWRVNRI